jgi:hypothetical protein
MSTTKQIFMLVFLVFILSIAYMFRDSIPVPPRQEPEPVVNDGTGSDDVVACTMDAMMCPDGTYVGRSGPHCEFVCPSPAAGGGGISLYEEFTVALDEPKVIGDTTIKARSIVEDSRCPSDVVCIQAGRALVVFDVSSPAGAMSQTISIGETITTDTLIFTLKEVQPYPMSTSMPSFGMYRVVMDVKGR